MQIDFQKSFKFPSILFGEVPEGALVYPYFIGYKRAVLPNKVCTRIIFNPYIFMCRLDFTRMIKT